LFLAQTPVYLQSLIAACEEQNGDGLWNTAHALRGSCANLGAEQMAARCGELELTSRQGTLASAKCLVARLEEEFEAVKKVLTAVR
jgi:HPt (histidine-containing phosphotransfer) domain-containing protein